VYTSSLRKKTSVSNKENPPEEQRYFRKYVLPLYWKLHQTLSEEEMGHLNQTLYNYPKTKELYGFVQMFRDHIDHLDSSEMENILPLSKKSMIAEIKSFVSFLIKDLDAVVASIHYTYCNGVIEGQINRLKFLKRMIYGRAGFELLRKRVLYRM